MQDPYQHGTSQCEKNEYTHAPSAFRAHDLRFPRVESSAPSVIVITGVPVQLKSWVTK